MDLALIAPPSNIELTRLLPGRFCIAGICNSNADYASFFSKAAYEGYNVIMDNGVWEGTTFDNNKLWEIALNLPATVIIAPDSITGDCNETVKLAQEFVNAYPPDGWEGGDWFKKPEIMIVPHVHPNKNDRRRFWDLLSSICRDETPYRWIGINRDTCNALYGHLTHTDDQEINRLLFTVEVQSRELVGNSIKWHYLGVGDRVDLIPYYWFVESMDSASFFWQPVSNENSRRPSDYFIRNWLIDDNELIDIKEACRNAQFYADQATTLKREIEGGRL